MPFVNMNQQRMNNRIEEFKRDRPDIEIIEVVPLRKAYEPYWLLKVIYHSTKHLNEPGYIFCTTHGELFIDEDELGPIATCLMDFAEKERHATQPLLPDRED